MTTLFGPVTRHHCPLPECGWSYDVDLGAEPLPPILLDAAAFDPVAFRVTDSRVLSEAISAASEKQRSELLERTETAIREHLQGHDFAEVVRALTEAQATVARVRALHRPSMSGRDCEACYDYDGDPLPWPCPTLAALDGGGEAPEPDPNEPPGGWGPNPDYKCFITQHDACEAPSCTCSCHRKEAS